MQCCDFEMDLAYMQLKFAEAGLDRHYHRLALADILVVNSVTTVDRLPDVKAVVLRLRGHIRDVA